MSTERTLEARQGDTYKLTLTWKDSSGTAVNLTGADAEFGIASRPGGSPNFQYDTSDHLTITAGTGTITIKVPHTETRKWTGRRYVYEVTVVHADSTRQTILHGALKVQPEVVA